MSSISNIEYGNGQEIISLTNSYGIDFWIGKHTEFGVIERFDDARVYSGELNNLKVTGNIYVSFGVGLKRSVDAFIPNKTRRNRILLS